MITALMTRSLSLAAFVSILLVLSGCAGTARPLMPTPALYHQPPAKTVFKAVPLERRQPRVELFFITDRTKETSPETGLPYGEQRARSLAFGNAMVEIVPALAWPDLVRQSRLAERSTEVTLEMGTITDVAREKLIAFNSDPDLISRWTDERLPRAISGRLTIYASPTDRALLASKILFRSRKRLGRLRPTDVGPAERDYFSKWGNIDLVIYEGKPTDFFDHSYFSSNPQVSSDLIKLICYGRAPGESGRPLERCPPWKRAARGG